MQTRREAILATASAAALAPLAARAAEMQTAPTPTAEGGRLNTLFDALFQEDLRRNPESATQLGLDKGANAGLKSQLRDESSAGIAAGRTLTADQLRRLKTLSLRSNGIGSLNIVRTCHGSPVRNRNTMNS